jgi:hypothetical protein
MECVWTNTVLQRPGKAGVRGFGGRILFHHEEQKDPVLVNGQLTVYAFDDENSNADDAAPEKKYIFPAVNLPKHWSQSALGHSYSFWLPWDEVGGRQRQISLIARFEDLSGKNVMSSLAHLTLPGKTPERRDGHATSAHDTVDSEASNSVRHVSYETPTGVAGNAQTDGLEQKPKMTTTTIDVTPGFASKLIVGRNDQIVENSPRKVPPPMAPSRDRGGILSGQVPHPPGVRNPSMDLHVPTPSTQLDPATAEPSAAAPGAGTHAPQASADAPSTHFALERFQVRTEQASPPSAGLVRRGPHRARSLSRLPPTPRSNWTRPRTTLNSAGQPPPN